MHNESLGFEAREHFQANSLKRSTLIGRRLAKNVSLDVPSEKVRATVQFHFDVFAGVSNGREGYAIADKDRA